jgi:hypothetical protein
VARPAVGADGVPVRPWRRASPLTATRT